MQIKSTGELRAAIKESGLTQVSLAEAIKVHPSYINHLTSGRYQTCTMHRARLIAAALGKQTTELFKTERFPKGLRVTPEQAAKAAKALKK